MNDYRSIFTEGLWGNNVAFVQNASGRQPHAEAVGAAGGDCHGRAHGQQLGEDDVAVPQAVLHDAAVVFAHRWLLNR